MNYDHITNANGSAVLHQTKITAANYSNYIRVLTVPKTPKSTPKKKSDEGGGDPAKAPKKRRTEVEQLVELAAGRSARR